MKNVLILFFALICSETFSQPVGSIVSKQSKPEAGKENVYVYTPPKVLVVPDSSKVFIIYNNGRIKKIPLEKIDSHYEFSFTAPDSTKDFIAGIADKKNNPIDTRNDKGYIVYLCNDKGMKYEGAKINAAQLINFYGIPYLQLNVQPDTLAAMYQSEYKQYPSQKEKTYTEYLGILYAAKKDAVKPQMLQYAKQQDALNTETNWNNARRVYQILKMNDELTALDEKIIKQYPTGSVAKQKAMNGIYEAQKSADKIALANAFRLKFGEANNDNLYAVIARSYQLEENWDKYMLYADSISSKDRQASVFNNTAWSLSGGSIDSVGKNIVFAKTISKKSIDILADEIKNPEKYKPEDEDIDDFKTNAEDSYNGYLDTYALLLYQANQADSAFYYENIVIQRPVGADAYERCAVYAEKANGATFAKQFIEDKMLQGYSTAHMKQQLKNIYKQLNLSDADYSNMMVKAEAVHVEKLKEEIKEKMKSGVAKNFTLKNLQGQTVSLASLKGKTIVVDFWATWCGPCKASFPGMQKAVDKYKDDKDVVFLFVDTWEDKEAKQMQSDAQNFIKQHNYSFKVLLDNKDKTVTDYNVRGIPTKFIINKDGNLQFTSVGFGGDEDELLEEISMMIDMAKGGNG